MSRSDDSYQRLLQLSDDNAFVNVNEVLKQEGVSVVSNEVPVSLLASMQKDGKGGRDESSFRFNSNAAIAEQHRSYLAFISSLNSRKRRRNTEDDEDEKEKVSANREVGSTLKLIPLSSTEAIEEEAQRTASILELWRMFMTAKDAKEKAPSAALQYYTTCPSFEGMTAPAINRTRAVGKCIHMGVRSHHSCSVCMLPAKYRCSRCRTALFCSPECHTSHEATRCLRFTV